MEPGAVATATAVATAAAVPIELQNLAAVGSFLSGIGLIIGAISVIFLAFQTMANVRATRATVYQSLVLQANAIYDMAIQHPEYHRTLLASEAEFPCMLGNVREIEVKETEVFHYAMKWIDHFELIYVQRDSIPKGLREMWDGYIEEYFERSGLLTKLAWGSGWYTTTLEPICRKAHGATQKTTYEEWVSQISNGSAPPHASAPSGTALPP